MFPIFDAATAATAPIYGSISTVRQRRRRGVGDGWVGRGIGRGWGGGSGCGDAKIGNIENTNASRCDFHRGDAAATVTAKIEHTENMNAPRSGGGNSKTTTINRFMWSSSENSTSRRFDAAPRKRDHAFRPRVQISGAAATDSGDGKNREQRLVTKV